MLHRRRDVCAVLAVSLVLAFGWTGDSYASPNGRNTANQRVGRQRAAGTGRLPGGSRHSSGTPAAQQASWPPAPSSTIPSPAAGSPPPAPPVAPEVGIPGLAAGTVARTTGADTVALTFDDGPGDQTLAILGLLRQYHVRATFCLIGAHVREHPELVRAIVRDGHTLCNHTWLHDMRLGQRSLATIRSDLQRTTDEIHVAVPGVPVRYFRHPGGMWTPAAVSVAQDMGMTPLGWDVDPGDWNTLAYHPGPAMTDHVIANLQQHVHPGAIVLSHDAGGDRTSTVAAYRVLLPYLLAERHLQLVPLPAGTRPGRPGGRDREIR